MYKIKVLKRGKVILGDLNIVLKHGDILDLDERFPRDRLDSSVNLRSAISGDDPAIAVLHKDVIVERGTDMQVLAAMESRIKESLAQQIADIHRQNTQNTQPDIANQLNQLISAIKSGSPVAVPSGSTKEPIADDKLVDIHTRAVQRLTKNVEGHVTSEQKNIESDAASRAKDLEGLF